ncbi:MAG: HEAT repeat domain-containing protein [Anaerolineae bacterium]|jgi:HEAT repeat protein
MVDTTTLTPLKSSADDIFTQVERAAELGQLRTRQAAAELLQLMEHDSPLVRSEAARELARIGRALRQGGRLMLHVGQPRSGILTAQVLLDELSAQVDQRCERCREAWAESLGQWRHQGAVPLLTALAADASPSVRAAAAQALGETHDVGAVAPLRRAAGDGDPSVRRNVAAAVGAVGLREGVDILAELRRDSDPLVRCTALLALGNLPGRQTLGWLHAALADPLPDVRWAAAHSLASVGRIASLPHLEVLYDDDTAICGGTISAAARQAALRIREREGNLWSRLLRALLWLGRAVKRALQRHR